MSDGFDPFDIDEWRDKPGCSAFEAALEMRARGALASGAMPVLDAHLGACDDCRDYAAGLRRLDAALANGNDAAPDWRRMQEKMSGALKDARRAPWLVCAAGVGVALLVSALCWLFARTLPPLRLFLLTIPVMVGGGTFGTYLRRRRLRRLLAEPDPIAAYRRWVELSAKGVRRMRWWLLPYAAFGLYQTICHYRRYVGGRAMSGAFVVLGVFSFLIFVGLVIWATRESRRLTAEMAELH